MQIVNTKYQIIRKYGEPHWQPRDYSYESLVGRLWNGFADLENDAEAAESDRENRAPPIERRSQNCALEHIHCKRSVNSNFQFPRISKKIQDFKNFQDFQFTISKNFQEFQDFQDSNFQFPISKNFQEFQDSKNFQDFQFTISKKKSNKLRNYCITIM